jgi:Domain of unknown function (DUF4359)
MSAEGVPMGLLKVRNWVGGILLVGVVGGLAATNPSQSEYEAYATQEVAAYLRSTICNEIPPTLQSILQNRCATLMENNRTEIHSQVGQLVSNHTTRTNCILFSLYQTQLKVPGLKMLPAYEFKTLGIGRHFFTYRAGQM